MHTAFHLIDCLGARKWEGRRFRSPESLTNATDRYVLIFLLFILIVYTYIILVKKVYLEAKVVGLVGCPITISYGCFELRNGIHFPWRYRLLKALDILFVRERKWPERVKLGII